MVAEQSGENQKGQKKSLSTQIKEAKRDIAYYQELKKNYIDMCVDKAPTWRQLEIYNCDIVKAKKTLDELRAQNPPAEKKIKHSDTPLVVINHLDATLLPPAPISEE